MIRDVDAGEGFGLHPIAVHGNGDVFHPGISFGRCRFPDDPHAIVKGGEDELALFVAGDGFHFLARDGVDEGKLYTGQVFPAGVHLDVFQPFQAVDHSGDGFLAAAEVFPDGKGNDFPVQQIPFRRDDLPDGVVSIGDAAETHDAVPVRYSGGHALAELIAQGVAVQLDGLGTFYPSLESAGADKPENYSTNEHVKGVHVRFLPDSTSLDNITSRTMKEKCSLRIKNIVNVTTLNNGKKVSTETPYGEYTSSQPSQNGEGAGQTGNENQNQGGNTNPPSGGGGGNEND